MTHSTLQEQTRMCQPFALEEAKRKPKTPKVGDIVRYVGAQKPKLSGMEGEVTKVEKSADWYDKIYVTWAGKGDLKEYYPASDVKVIKGYSKRFKGTPRLEQTSDGMEWTGLGCDVCGYGSVEDVDTYDPAKPCPDCGVTMEDGAHYISEGALKTIEKKLLAFNIKHWDKVPKPIQKMLRILYGKKKPPKISAPKKAVIALSQQLAKVGIKKPGGSKGGVFVMQAFKEEILIEQRALAGLEDNQEPVVEDDNIGKTILQQMGGRGRIKAMTGASQFIALPKGIGFKFPNKKRSRGNYVEITLRADDTYNVEFFSVTIKGRKTVKKYQTIYADQLISIFEDQTGLYLRL